MCIYTYLYICVHTFIYFYVYNTICAYIVNRWNFENFQEFKNHNELENVYLNYHDVYIVLDSCISLQIEKCIKCHHRNMFEVDSFKEFLFHTSHHF